MSSRSEKETTKLTCRSNWSFQDSECGRTVKTQAVVLGLGSMFNHSLHGQNVGWERNLPAQCITYRALRDIRAGEELCISYGKVWFVDVDASEEEMEGDELDALRQIELP